MRCPNCGQLLADGAARCPACEMIIADWMEAHPEVQKVPEIRQEDPYEELQQPQIMQAAEEVPAKPDRPMRWYWFLVHIALVFSSFMNFWSGYQLLTGASYGGKDAAAQIYAVYEGMKTVDMMYGALLILSGILALYVRSQLYHYRKNGPRKLLLLYALNCLVALYYSVGVSMITGLSLKETDIQYVVPTSVIMIIINKIYFDNRKHLFRN